MLQVTIQWLMLYILYCTVLYNGCVVAMDCCYFVTQMYQSYTPVAYPLPHFTYQPGVQTIQKITSCNIHDLAGIVNSTYVFIQYLLVTCGLLVVIQTCAHRN